MAPSKHSVKVKDISEKCSDRDKYESAQNKIYLSPDSPGRTLFNFFQPMVP